IFDFDGVISDSEILHLEAFNEVLSKYGVEITRDDYYREYLGLTDVDCFKALAEEGRLKVENHETGNLVKDKNEIFEEKVRTDGRIIEGVRSFLDMLKDSNIRMAICSGALLAEIALILQQAGLSDMFEVIVSADQVTKGKPDPEGFVLALQRLNEGDGDRIPAEGCVVVEDSHWGLEAAKRAGMHTIAVTNSYGAEQLAMADRIVARLDELTIDDLEQLCA
ncbi:MAG: HAD family hydrolase, partial [Planctomycetota bacterium]